MKVLFSTILIAILARCYGYSYVIPANLKFPGVCFYNGRILPKGDSQLIPGACQNTKCNDDGSISVDGCGRITLPKCTLVKDVSLMKSYPDCCDMIYQCTDTDGAIYTKEWNQLYPSGKLVQAEIIDVKEALNQEVINNNEAIKKTDQGDPKLISPFIIQLMLDPVRVSLNGPHFRWINGNLVDTHTGFNLN